MDQSYLDAIENSFLNQEYLGNLDQFIDDIINGKEDKLSLADLKHFIMIAPSEEQIKSFLHKTGGNFEAVVSNRAVNFVV